MMAISTADLAKLVNDIAVAASQIPKLGTVSPASYQSKKTGNLLGGKVFEAWVLLKLGVALAADLSKRSGSAFVVRWNGPVHPGTGTQVIDTQQRDAPWLSNPPGSSPHVQIMLGPLVVFEIYNSIRLKGHSGVKHEGDIVLRSDITWNGQPYLSPDCWLSAKPRPHIAVIELKLHGEPISLGLVRQAALTRLDVALGGPPANNPSCSKVARYIPGSKFKIVDLASYHGFATYSPPSKDAGKLADHYGVDLLMGIGSEVIGGSVSGSTIAELAESLLDWTPT